MAIKGYNGDADDLRQVAAFLLEIADTTALYCIVIGVALAVLALVGLIASCCGWHKVLKIVSWFEWCQLGIFFFTFQYIAILIVLLVAQIIIVVVLFSNPIKFANNIISSKEALLKSYGDKSEEGNTSTVIWNVLMKNDPTCCGMDGYKDFEKQSKPLPLPGCNITSGSCFAVFAKIVGVPGCRHKVELIATLRSTILSYFSIATIFMQYEKKTLTGTLFLYLSGITRLACDALDLRF
ncbi:Tetraspanin-16 [Taenia solium]